MSKSMTRRKKKKRYLIGIVLAIILVTVLLLIPTILRRFVYPKDYSEYVIEYSKDNNVDSDFIFAVIKTESGFDTSAESDVGAFGLMQIMPDAFEWTRDILLKEDRSIEFSEMKTPKINVRYGCAMLGWYYKKYNSYELSAAAYHAGTTKVDSWISDGTISVENFDVEDIPTASTKHYIKKVMKAYKAYQNLY